MRNIYMKHFLVECYWCKTQLNKRADAYKREMSKHGHCCCKKCFGKEQSFKDAQSRRMRTNNPFKGKMHSDYTKQLISKNTIGRVPYNKGVKNPKRKKSSVVRWIEFRDYIINRDVNKCCKCNNKFESSNLHVHHLLSRTRNPDKEFDELNCITLCARCHRDFHRKFGVLKFTVYNWVNWINETRNENERFIIH